MQTARALLFAPFVFLSALEANAETFHWFVEGIWPDAKKQGISKRTFDRATSGLKPSPKVSKLAKKQPEFAQPIGKYIAKRLGPTRVNIGKKKVKRNRRLLDNIQKRTGVDPYVVAAIWGMETAYGGYSGKSDVFNSLVTLAYRQYRGDFFRKQFIDAMTIMQNEKVPRKRMVGSWAGAMGQTQFIPSSFLKHAIDFDKDGKRDLWKSVPDALGSTANYLKNNGWVVGQPWGHAVKLPGNMKKYAFTQPWKDWASSGVSRLDKGKLPTKGEATLFFPAGAEGPAYLVTPNYEVIKSYNFSDAYALSVGQLAHSLRGTKSAAIDWPTASPLTKSQRMKVQTLMVKRGRKVPNRIGRISHDMRMAIRDLQLENGRLADGYPDQKFLKWLSR